MEKPETTEEKLETLRRQLTAFAQFTTSSLGEADIDAVMLEGCLRGRAGLNMSHAKLLEYLPDRDRLLLRAGVGWKEGYVGQYQVSPDIDTPIGYAFAFSEPVGISDYISEKRHQFPSILKDHGCISSLNVPVRTDLGVFGILEVDDTRPRQFSSDDVYFLTGLGNTIAKALELRHALNSLDSALGEKQLLLHEMNHRIKNNLSLVAAMLSLQGRGASDARIREELGSAAARINNMALVHDRLQLFTSSAGRVDAAVHFRELCDMLRSVLPPRIALISRCSGWIAGDHVESLTLIANELVTNAAKHAFAGREDGEIQLGYRQEGAAWRLWVQDNGSGLSPQGGSPPTGSFGRQLLEALTSRVNADIAYSTEGGTIVVVTSGVMT